ncbi:MFS transporter [Neobacillus sp. PS3-12]|jgi:MFS family permease|uniref:MFS transporter n=1 Tax=Neobacillus sp. PS3-12 TaxID=3070677 RepID=UPI0027E0B31F|nr:MFS transporter [Neobacillus sp. PS3-12]WML54568.1 MFS transporter [Neobacillus sp. PS3-12]
MNKPKLWTKDFISVSLSNFFLFSTFYFLLVTLPVFSIDHFHTSSSEAGLMTTVFLVSAIISRPFAGQWIEHSGFRNVLIAAMLISLLSSLLYFFPKTITTFLILRFIHGIGFGMATTAAGAIVATIIPASRRGEGMGYFIMSTNLAMVLGPFIGLTAIQQWGANTLFIISIVAAAGAFVTGMIVKVPKTVQRQAQKAQSFSFKNLFEASAVPISIVGAFFAIIYSSLLSFVSVYASEIHLGSVSSLFFVVYAIILLAARPFTGRGFDLFGANKIVFPSIVFYAIGILLLSQAHGAGSFLTSAGLIGLGWGSIFPILQTIAIQDAQPHRKGVATATFLSIYDTGMGLGSLIVGIIAAHTGFRSLYLIGSIYVVLGIVLYYALYARHRVSPKKQSTNQQTSLDKVAH